MDCQEVNDLCFGLLLSQFELQKPTIAGSIATETEQQAAFSLDPDDNHATN
jgi:hypothetical protein